VPSPVLVELDCFVPARAFTAFLDDVRQGAFVIEDLRERDYVRIAELLDEYADLRIGFVDAAVLAVVERRREKRLATLDRRRFGVLRPRHARALQLLPEP
jgi:predicted nucleic acid-binding protein